MEIEKQRTFQRINYTLLVACLLAVLGALGWMVYITTDMYSRSGDPQTRGLLFRMAWVAATAMGLSIIVLVWVVIRWVRLHLKGQLKLPESIYIDAWSAAGKRIRLPDENNHRKIEIRGEEKEDQQAEATDGYEDNGEEYDEDEEAEDGYEDIGEDDGYDDNGEEDDDDEDDEEENESWRG